MLPKHDCVGSAERAELQDRLLYVEHRQSLKHRSFAADVSFEELNQIRSVLLIQRIAGVRRFDVRKLFAVAKYDNLLCAKQSWQSLRHGNLRCLVDDNYVEDIRRER